MTEILAALSILRHRRTAFWLRWSRAQTLIGDGIPFFEFFGREATVSNFIINQRHRNHSGAASGTRPHGVRSTRRCPTALRGRAVRFSRTTCTNHFDRIPPFPQRRICICIWGMGNRESGMVRLRIFSVPCGGSSWRRDRLPKDDDVTTIDSSASRAERTLGNVASPRRRSYAPARRPGLL